MSAQGFPSAVQYEIVNVDELFDADWRVEKPSPQR